MVTAIKIAIVKVTDAGEAIMHATSRTTDLPAPLLVPAKSGVPAPSSITHQHLLSLINTESQQLGQFRLLDVGCGTGNMLAYMTEAFRVLRPGAQIELHGMDVTSVGFDKCEDFFPSAPNIRVIPSGEPWPYPDGYFDFVVSNQVLEHVKDADAFFAQIHRVLREGGISYHIFPLRNIVWEGHLLMPLAHRFADHDAQVKWIRLMHKLGFKSPTVDPEDAADSLLYYTHYRSRAELLGIIKRAGLRPSFRHTPEYYFAKLRSILKITPRYLYKPRRTGWPALKMLSYVASITLRAEKTNLHQ
jgi:SAM-dependent methyltransferase